MTDRQSSSVRAFAVLGILLGTGIALAGFFVGRALFAARATDRFVTVRGLAEQEVRADLAIWPIVFNTTGDDLGAVQQRLETNTVAVYSFLAEHGFREDERSVSAPRVTDLQAQGGTRRSPGGRYTAETTVTVRSGAIDRVQSAMQRSGALVKAGVAMIRSYEYQPQFLYTALESIKPEMIAAATRDARRAAEQFAEDSQSRVGAIRNAQQGYFSIQDRDPFSPDYKRVRVVTTVQYFLAGE